MFVASVIDCITWIGAGVLDMITVHIHHHSCFLLVIILYNKIMIQYLTMDIQFVNSCIWNSNQIKESEFCLTFLSFQIVSNVCFFADVLISLRIEYCNSNQIKDLNSVSVSYPFIFMFTNNEKKQHCNTVYLLHTLKRDIFNYL